MKDKEDLYDYYIGFIVYDDSAGWSGCSASRIRRNYIYVLCGGHYRGSGNHLADCPSCQEKEEVEINGSSFCFARYLLRLL